MINKTAVTTAHGIAMSLDGKSLYVTGWLNNNMVSVIDVVTGFVIKMVNVGANPRFVAVDPVSGFVYVTHYGGNSISIINPATQTVVQTLSANAPAGFAFKPAGI